MIRSRRLQNFLLAASVRTEKGAWRLFHETVRRAYLGPILRLLASAFRPKDIAKEDFELIARHSSTRASDFNAFMSDLDLSVVLSDRQIKAAPEVVRRFYWWRRRLPFIGELELYSRSEFEELQGLFENQNGIYPEIRRVRKLSWMENLLPKPASDYHRFKAERSIAKILSKEDIDYSMHSTGYRALFSRRVEAWIGKTFKKVISNEASCDLSAASNIMAFRSDYFSSLIWMSRNHAPQLGEISLPVLHAWILLALTPRASFDDPNINAVVSLLRSDPAVHEHWSQISRIECLVYRAVLRAQETVTEGELNWLQGFIDSWNLSIESRKEVSTPSHNRA